MLRSVPLSIHVLDDDSTQADGSPLLDLGAGPWVFGGRYEIHALLGVGGMGSVYKALDRELDDLIALKVIRKDLLSVAGVVDRFRREVKLARKVTHKNVARVYDLGESEGERYLTMELVDGVSLGTTLSDGALPLALALRMGRQISEGLAAAHAAGVIHRDLKPDNVILGRDDRAVITDFGIARTLSGASGPTTLDGSWIGTPVYMAPELIEGGALADESCDVYALGVVLFEAVTQTLPWKGETDVAIAIDRLQRPPIDPRELRQGLPDAFAEIILRCLSRERGQRFATAQAVGRALSSVILPTTSSIPSALPPRSPLDTLPAWSLDKLPLALAGSTSGSSKTVAVLPFREAGDAVEPYVTDGLTESLIGALSQDPELRVRPRGMVMTLRGSQARGVEMGQRLDVQVVVEGTVDRQGEDLVIVVRVTSVPTRFRIWAGTFERRMADVLGVGDEIASAVAQSLATTHRASKRQAPPRDARVADLYLRARHAYHTILAEDAARSVALYVQALTLAPDDAPLWAGYALACVRESAFTGVGFQAAQKAAERASELDPHEPGARLALAAVKLQRGDSVAAIGDLKAALAGDPSLGEAHALLGRILLEADVLETAKKRLEWAIAIDPEQTIARRDLARAHALGGRFEEVERLAAAESDDAGAWLDRARFTLWRRNPDAAALYLDALRARYRDALDGSRGPIGLARALLACGASGASPYEDDAFIDFVGLGRGTPRRSAFVSQIEAEVLAACGRDEDSLVAIERATEAGLSDLAWLDRCPLFSGFRGRAPFEAARARVGAIAALVREAVFDD